MSSKVKVKILVGVFAGQIVEAESIGSADTAEQSRRWNDPVNDRKLNFYETPEGKAQSKEVDECWTRNKGDGVWVEMTINGRTHKRRYTLKTEAIDIGTPYDKKDREIMIDDVVVYAMRDLTVSELKVEKIVVSGGTTTLHGTDLHTGKKTKNSYPERCLKVSP